MRRLLFALGLVFIFGSTFAEERRVFKEPENDSQGSIKQKTHHRLQSGTPSELIPPWLKKGTPGSVAPQPTAGSTSSTTPITNHGGTVMNGVNAIYLIWYGNWAQTNNSDTAAGQKIIRDLIYGLASVSSTNTYSAITTGTQKMGYYTSASGNVSQISSMKQAEYADNYTQGKSLTDASILKIVKNAIANGLGAVGGKATPNPDAIYLVLTSSDVKETSGFCSKFCGWHTYSTFYSATAPIKYVFAGNTNQCLGSCAAQTLSPNGNPGVDGMASVIAHELMETVSDPLLNAWYDSSGSENADKCGWTYGSSQTKMSTGAYYNVTLPALSQSTRNFHLQRALAAGDSKCYINAAGGQ